MTGPTAPDPAAVEPWEQAYRKWVSTLDVPWPLSLGEELRQSHFAAGYAAGRAEATGLVLTAFEADLMLRCLDRCGAVWAAPDNSPWGEIRRKLHAIEESNEEEKAGNGE